MPRRTSPQQPGLFDSHPPILWPDVNRFPHNSRDANVDRVVGRDIRVSAAPFVITSYTSLDRVLSLLAHLEALHSADPEQPQEARIVIGHEPSRTHRKEFRDNRHRFEQEIADFWLRQGISISRSAHVIAAIQCLNREEIQVRTSGERVIHAKIYVTEVAATLGSSNYSISGMLNQAEANCRFTADEEPDRYHQTTQLAEAIWQEARDYKEALKRLLSKLLLKVDWQEALGRACAELLEGSWISEDLRSDAETPSLWPSQRAGVAQALWILDNAGSVLVADATGSGKTRMGAQLLAAIKTRRIRNGRARLDPVALICPPAVESEWRKESISCGLDLEPHSHGVLSNRQAGAREHTVEAVRRSSILAVDEAHHYLNRATVRTQVLYRNVADHVVLFTATPINRGAQDLLAIVDLLGADNFEDDVVKTVERAWRRRSRSRNFLSGAEEEQVRAAIQRFTVRRTKAMLNALVLDDIESYRSQDGKICQYPEQQAHPYPCLGTELDRDLAARIRAEANNLRGLTHLRKPLKLPAYFKAEGLPPEKYLETRLNGAQGLAIYQVVSTLRSSRAALLEHIHGTVRACNEYGIPLTVKAENTGDVIGRLSDISGQPPKSHLGVALPEFLATSDGHRQACREEIATYERIGDLLGQMSSEREDSKAGLLALRMRNHQRVLAFDSFLITLHDLRERLRNFEGIPILLATGESKADRLNVRRAFARQSKDSAIALCSDALSEGVNLQGASAVVLLDMPSVIRVAEQRIGRIDRMNSPYEKIEVFWPDDSPEFAIRSNELFLSRVKAVADLIGSNLKLPPALQASLGPEGTVGFEQMQRILQYCRDAAINIRDAFHPVRGLINGPGALVQSAIYESVRKTDVRIQTAVSVVRAEARWGFYALRASNRSAPRWVYLDQTAEPISDLDIIVGKLRARLRPDTPNRALDGPAARAMSEDTAILQQWEENLLPGRKRKALDLMRNVLSSYIKTHDPADSRRGEVLRDIQRLVRRVEKPNPSKWPFTDEQTSEEVVDFDVIADWWLEKIRPVWHQHLTDPRRKSAARLKDLRKELVVNPIATTDLESLFHIGATLWMKPVATRVVAAIVGVPDPEEQLQSLA